MTQFFDLIKTYSREFPGSPGVGLHAFTIKGQGSIPDQGTKISQAMQHGQRAGCVCGGGVWRNLFQVLLLCSKLPSNLEDWNKHFILLTVWGL